jgi:hypothetical protein
MIILLFSALGHPNLNKGTEILIQQFLKDKNGVYENLGVTGTPVAENRKSDPCGFCLQRDSNRIRIKTNQKRCRFLEI